MNLRQQLQLKRSLRNLRTWAPPISLGVILGVGLFMLSDQLDRAPATEAAQVASRSYESCDAAQADGATPIHIGDPGYAPHLDRDSDGVACEPYLRSNLKP